MKTFKQFLSEEDYSHLNLNPRPGESNEEWYRRRKGDKAQRDGESYSDYTERMSKMDEKDAVDSNRRFKDYNGKQWYPDDEFEAEIRKHLVPKNVNLWRFIEWVSKSFGILRSKIYIVIGHERFNNYTKFEITLSQQKFKQADSDFIINLMLKHIPQKWNAYMPDEELKWIELEPKFDASNPNRLRRINGKIRANPEYNDSYIEGIRHATTEPTNPDRIDADVKQYVDSYAHRRKLAWKSIRYDSITGDMRDPSDRGKSEI